MIKKSRLILKSFSIAIALLFVFSHYLFLPTALNLPPKFSSKAHASYKQFVQNDWTGGVDAGPHVINWTSDNWNKYSSASDVDLSGGDIVATADGASLESSILDLGSAERATAPGFSYSDDGVTVSIRGANTSGGVSSATWADANSGCLASYRFIQYKVDFTTAGLMFYDITFGNTSFSINGGVKSSSGADLEGATIQVIENSVTTTNKEQSSKGGPYIGYNTSWVYHNGDATSYTVRASKNGYNSQIKSASYNISNCTTWATLNFSLTPAPSSTSSTSGVNENPTTTTDSITKVKLPGQFTKPGSKTTDLSKIKDPKKVGNLVLDVLNIATIQFKEAVDLSNSKTIAAFEKLTDYLKIGNGFVDLNSKVLSALNKKATLTLHKLKHSSTPEILVDGKKDTTDIASNIIYDEKTGKLTFDVAHFTRFDAAVKFEIIDPASTKITDPNTIIKVKVSDPDAAITGSFNDVGLAKITPDKKTGEFTLEKLAFQEGDNSLKLDGESKIGKVAPLEVAFTYGAEPLPNRSQTNTALIIAGTIGVVVFIAALGYLLYKRRGSFLGKKVEEDKAKEESRSENQK